MCGRMRDSHDSSVEKLRSWREIPTSSIQHGEASTKDNLHWPLSQNTFDTLILEVEELILAPFQTSTHLSQKQQGHHETHPPSRPCKPIEKSPTPAPARLTFNF